ncbi:MAG: DUF885 domain-containing protein [Candidatus Marinimicrobia bacterium]|nr:DUF885 domain-containing protein [Candidatus Neomarinimicrobiota bacterium]
MLNKKKIILFFCFFIWSCSDTNNSANEVKSIADELYEIMLEDDIGLKMKFGLPVTKFPDMDYETASLKVEQAKTFINKIDAVDRNKISHTDDLTLSMMRQHLQTMVDGLPHYWNGFSITPYMFGWQGRSMQQVFLTYQFDEEDDQDIYLSLMDEYADHLNQQLEKLKGQDNRGIRLPKPELPLVMSLLDQYKSGMDATFIPIDIRLSFFDDNVRDVFTSSIRKKISDEILPSLQGLIDFLNSDYKMRIPDDVGAYQYPGGEDYYNYMIEYHTNSGLTAKEIHEIGLKRVEELFEEMARVRGQLGFEKGQRAFHDEIMNDPYFIAEKPADVEERYMAYMGRIEPHISRLFRNQPEAPYGVRRLDEALEGAMTFGYYQVPTAENERGEYNYNGSDLKNRPMLWSGPLIYHELAPGHHFQINLNMENESVHKIRKDIRLYNSSITEGWGNYAAFLAEEIGMLEKPLDQYGWLVFQMFFYNRLVLDTGMNALGWSLEEAREFMRKHTFATETEIQTETLRYSVDMPGQALAYALGMDRLILLRNNMKNQLGDQFDIRDFHDAVLKEGAMPLNILEAHINWTIEDLKKD